MAAAAAADLAEDLFRLGLAGPTARVFAALVLRGPCVSRELERAALLRQPQVSLAVKDLRARGWVQTRAIRKLTRGRPVHEHTATVPLHEAVQALEAAHRENYAALQAAAARAVQAVSA